MENLINQKLLGFFLKYKKVSYRKGEYVIQAEEEPAGIFYLKKGFVKMNSIFENGSELTLNIFKPGSFFPMTWALGETKNTYFYQAMTDTQVLKAPKEKVLEFVKNNIDIFYDLVKRILVGFDGLLLSTQHLLYGNSESRVASAILIGAKRFGKVYKNGNVEIKLPLTHQDIAGLAGITRETATLALKKLRKKGIITQQVRKFIVKDMDELEKESFIFESKP